MKRVKVGDVIRHRMPWSEACMSMKVAEQVRSVQVLEHSARILNDDGTPYSFPITHGEAGIYQDAEGLYIQQEVKS